MQEITVNRMAKLLPSLFKAGVVPFIKGSAGIGKSAIAHQVAEQFKLKVIDIRLAECDPTDITGVPFIDQKSGKSAYYPNSMYPVEGDKIPEGYNGYLLLLDEFNSAPIAVQAASYKLVLDRMVGQHKLHPNVFIIAAGNREEDNAIVNPMSTALVSRFAHFNVRVDKNEWLEWAASQNIDYRITSYINFRPDNLYTFNPNSTEPYAAPRTWAMLDRLLKPMETITFADLPLLSSLIGEGVANEFINYINIVQDLPSFNELINNPNIKLKDDLSVKFAVMGMLSYNASENTLDRIIQITKQFTEDLQVVALKDINQRHPELRETKSFMEWKREMAKLIFTNE